LGEGSYPQHPDELAAQIISEGRYPLSTALEALALEGYSTEQISEAEIRRLFGFENRMEGHAFLKKRCAFLQSSFEDAAKDRETALECALSGYRVQPLMNIKPDACCCRQHANELTDPH
jgi:hypothetical protein